MADFNINNLEPNPPAFAAPVASDTDLEATDHVSGESGKYIPSPLWMSCLLCNAALSVCFFFAVALVMPLYSMCVCLFFLYLYLTCLLFVGAGFLEPKKQFVWPDRLRALDSDGYITDHVVGESD